MCPRSGRRQISGTCNGRPADPISTASLSVRQAISPWREISTEMARLTSQCSGQVTATGIGWTVAGTLHTFQFGLASDLKVPADFDGDGKTDIAIFRPGENLWVIAQSSDGKIVYRTWGTAGDIPVPADYDGDGRADLAVFRPSDGTWYIQKSTNKRPVGHSAWTCGRQACPGRLRRRRQG